LSSLATHRGMSLGGEMRQLARRPLVRDQSPERDTTMHAGVLVPWANSVVEAELPRWVQGKVTWHYSRLVPPSRVTALDERFLTGLLEAVPAALAQLAALRLRTVYLACTSAGFMLPGQARDAISGSPVQTVTAFDALVVSLQERGASRVVLLTPYSQSVTDTEVVMFGNAGITVTEYASLGLDDGYADVGTDQVEMLASRISDKAAREAQAIVLSCTGWPTYDRVSALQQRFARPVISSNLAIATDALRLAEKSLWLPPSVTPMQLVTLRRSPTEFTNWSRWPPRSPT
jgi:maleate isomerase